MLAPPLVLAIVAVRLALHAFSVPPPEAAASDAASVAASYGSSTGGRGRDLALSLARDLLAVCNWGETKAQLEQMGFKKGNVTKMKRAMIDEGHPGMQGRPGVPLGPPGVGVSYINSFPIQEHLLKLFAVVGRASRAHLASTAP